MNCSSLQLKVFATILFVAANAMNQANAQTSVLASEMATLPATPQAPPSAISSEKRGQKLIIITSKEPTEKRTCHFDSATSDEIRCQQRFSTHPAIYRMADVDTIFEPATSHFYWWNFAVFFAIGGSIIWGASLLGAVSAIAIIGAIPIGLIGAFYVLASLAMSRDDYKEPMVLYQKPGTTLAVKLR